MAKITYATKYDLYEDTSINETNKVVASDMNEIKEAVNTNENKILVAVSDTAPSTCATGDVYYNTSTKKLYTATATNTWSSTGTNPTPNTIYILFDTKTTYSYDGTDLISVGGGGAEISIGTTQPSEDEVLWINPNEAPSGSLNPISNTYGVAQDKGYSQEYVNKNLVYSTTEINTGKTWIDGKPIYRKVISGTYNDNATILSNVSTLISVSGTGDVGTGLTRIIPYYEYYNGQTYACRLNFQSNSIKIEGKSSSVAHNATVKLVLEYTKTTD